MKGHEHYEKAEALLDQAHTVDHEFAVYLVAKAQAHATLALFDHLREVGDQLDTLPRKSSCAHGAVICGLCGYGVPAGDGGRS